VESTGNTSGTGGTAGSSGSGGVAGSGGTAGTGGSGGTAGTGGIAGASGTAGTAGTSGTGGCDATNMCNVDFPCYVMGVTSLCVEGDPGAYFEPREVSCEEACGTPCCGGGACDIELKLCDPDQVCAYPNADPPVALGAAACVDALHACGGPINHACPEGEYWEIAGQACPESSYGYCTQGSVCDYAAAGGLGTCRPLPTEQECQSAPGPVCGCDGVTYDNDCARKKAGAAYASAGPCP